MMILKATPPPAARLVVGVVLLASVVVGVSVRMDLEHTQETPGLSIPAEVRAQFKFPVGDPDKISSPFGPRWKWSKGRDDFHGGIDFFNRTGVFEDIYAIGDGVIYAKYVDPDPRFPSGGNTLSIEHTLARPIDFHGVNVTKMYSVYLHLANFADGIIEGNSLSRNTIVGKMGMTGDTQFIHLHFETRLGTMCSLPYQHSHPSSSCSMLQKEPKVNPFLFIPAFDNGKGTSVLTIYNCEVYIDRSNNTVTYRAPNRRNLMLNKIQFGSIELDFNLYKGFDPSDLNVLDNFDTQFTWGKLVPGVFLSTSDTYSISLVINSGSMPSKGSPFKFYDVFGAGVIATEPTDNGLTSGAASSHYYRHGSSRSATGFLRSIGVGLVTAAVLLVMSF